MRCAVQIDRARKRKGQALIEAALVLPLLLILIANVVNFAGLYYAFVEVGNATRAAGDYTIMGTIAYSGTDASGASAPQLHAPSDNGLAGAQLVANMLATDMSSLPNATSIAVRVCELNPSNAAISNATCNICNNGSSGMTCAAGSGSFTVNPSPDSSTGEGGSYTLTWVDVSYTFTPFVPLSLQFPGLGLAVTLPSNLVVHRQSVYRVLN